MKKICSLLTIIMIAVSTTFVSAQTIPNTTTTSNSKVVHTKKDGTADKRFKENKASKTVTGPLKADGTPDMRYKANKKTTTSTTKKKVQ